MKEFKKIEIAPNVGIEQYLDMVDSFVKEIFDIDEGCLVTDESSLTDFLECVGPAFKTIEEAREYVPTNEEIEQYEKQKRDMLKKIEDVYGVDVSDIEDLNLMEVLQRIRIINNI